MGAGVCLTHSCLSRIWQPLPCRRVDGLAGWRDTSHTNRCPRAVSARNLKARQRDTNKFHRRQRSMECLNKQWGVEGLEPPTNEL